MEGRNERFGTSDVQCHSRSNYWKNAWAWKANPRIFGVSQWSHDDNNQMGYLVSPKSFNYSNGQIVKFSIDKLTLQQAFTRWCFLLDFCQNFGNGFASTSHWTTRKILCYSPFGTFHPWLWNDCSNLLLGRTETSLWLHLQNVSSFGNSFWNGLELSHHANHNKLSG